jgi:polysaccharide export outer membrane protein
MKPNVRRNRPPVSNEKRGQNGRGGVSRFMFKSIARAVALTVLAALCFMGAGAEADEPSSARPSEPYRIQPGDILTFSVWKEPDLQGDVLVRPDGGLSFALVGDIQAERMTLDQLKQELARRLEKYVPDPSVAVALKQLGGNRIYVLGKVNRPGEFPFSRSLDVMQAISLAGGTTPFASVNDIQILRRKPDGTQDAVEFHYAEVERGRGLRQNILLASGDTVVVP